MPLLGLSLRRSRLADALITVHIYASQHRSYTHVYPCHVHYYYEILYCFILDESWKEPVRLRMMILHRTMILRDLLCSIDTMEYIGYL
jgi:hypothetical protein